MLKTEKREKKLSGSRGKQGKRRKNSSGPMRRRQEKKL
jgi:hypothetical protein